MQCLLLAHACISLRRKGKLAESGSNLGRVMADRVETKNDAVCEYAKQLSLSDVLCAPEKPAASPAAAQAEVNHLYRSPFGNNPGRAPQPPWEKTAQPTLEKPSQAQPLEKPQIPKPQQAQPVPPFNGFEPPKKAPQNQNQGNLPPFKIDIPQKPQQKPQSKAPTVYVDIGHCTSKDPHSGKTDHGFQGPYNECQINKAVGKLLIDELKGSGFRVVTTWNPDSPPPLLSKAQDLERRNGVVNSDIAANKGDSIYLSIHHDNDAKQTSGQCVYYAEPKAAQSMTLARTIQASAWRVRDGHEPSCIDPDTLTNNKKLVGLRGVNTIGILIEGANVQNSYDKQMMVRPEFQRAEAKSIANGVRNYFKLRAGSERPLPPSIR